MSAQSCRLLRLADIAATPWKNGGGVTREIATGALPGGPEPSQGWGWRVSVAEVAQDGPFSLFPETDRIIAVIEGAGMDLQRPDGTTLPLEPFQPVRFAGDEPFDGRLRGGPLRDLNVMVRRGLFTAEMEIREGPGTFEVPYRAGGCLAIFALAGSCKLRTGNEGAPKLESGAILLIEGSGSAALEVSEGSRAALIRVTPG